MQARDFSSTVNAIDIQLEADDPVSTSVRSESNKVNLYALSAPDLEQLLVGWGQPKFRSKQIRSWLYEKGVDDYEKMLDLPKDLRARLASETMPGTLSIAAEQQSKDGTVSKDVLPHHPGVRHIHDHLSAEDRPCHLCILHLC